MLLIVSPAKTLDFDSPVPEHIVTRPEFTQDAAAAGRKGCASSPAERDRAR